MSKDYYYHVLTINAFELTRFANSEHILNKTKKPSYHIDLYDPLASSLIVSKEAKKTNALFDQILLDNGDEFRELRRGLSDIDFLIKSIIIVDFSEIFNTFGGIDGVEEKIKEISKDTIPFSTSDHLKRLLTPYYDGNYNEDDLLRITYEDGQDCCFLPFDKSSSMSKKSRITFINSKLRDILDLRLQMDFPFNKMELQLSKYYAYRGLYLSSGIRIDKDNDRGFELNENTVLVVSDLMLDPKGNFLPENDENNPLPLLFTSSGTPEHGKPHEFCIKRCKPEKINAFDGEGLILPEYTKFINERLGYTASSFQIRMPFVKGMLHEVDFRSFLEIDDSCSEITDCFGIKRSLKDVRIILTASMFKCFKWLKNNSEEKAYDPVKAYFKGFDKYDHALYVCGTNASIPPAKTEVLNYQFLDTMALTSDEFCSLIEKHFDNSWDELYRTYRGDGYSKNTIIEAAKINSGFYSDPLLVEQAVKSCHKMRSELLLGHLCTEGGHFYLSSDLLAFLYYLKDLQICSKADSANLPQKNGYFDNHRDDLLDECFYIPKSSLSLSADRYYSILRSPHLARTEELLLRPHLPNTDKDLYEKYFGHLSGILMFPAASFSAEIIQDADFDGDYCKIYTDESITAAVKRGAYTDSFQRKLPITIVPNEDSPTTVPNDQEFVKLIINTFSSFIGLISNIAFKFAETEYNTNSTEACNENLCDLTGPITCLEIDSCKHGRHPYEDIKYLQKKASKKGENSRNFIKLKNLVKKYGYPKITEHNGTYSLLFYNGQAPVNVKSYDSSSHNLFRLPYEFAYRSFHATDETDRASLIEHGIFPEVPNDKELFTFEDSKEKYGVSNISDAGVKEALKLFNAYKLFRDNYKKYRKDLNAIKNIPEFAFLYTLLGAKYDSINGKLPLEGKKLSKKTVSETLDELITLLRKSSISLDERTLTDWIFTKKEERLDFLSKIGLNKTDISHQIEVLVCDFSFDGFLILGMAAAIAKKQNDYLNAIKNFPGNTKKQNDYYEEFRKLFDSKLGSLNQDDFKNDDTDEEAPDEETLSEDQDLSFTEKYYFDKLINEKCYRLLLLIASKYNTASQSDINIAAVKYAWAVTYGKKKKDTSFFWDILPKNDILSQVRREF